jgi:hypothetical protein
MNGEPVLQQVEGTSGPGEDVQGEECESKAPCATPVPKKRARVAKAKAEPDQAPKAERSDTRGDTLFFPMLLATKRKLEKEARAARMSSLSIV